MSAERHWRCPECATFDGPTTLGRCDVCVDASDSLVDVEPFVPEAALRAWIEDKRQTAYLAQRWTLDDLSSFLDSLHAEPGTDRSEG